MIKNIVIASSNKNKIKEYKRILSPLGFNVLSMGDLNINNEIVENGKSFEENSLIKARFLSKYVKDSYVIGDDSGLEIDALNGFPGIYSHRFMENYTYQEKQEAILNKMKDLDNRNAHFTSCIALIDLDKKEHIFIGKAYGKITTCIKGEGGFGYDPIFYSNELNMTFGEASPCQKDSVSHRKKAIDQLVNYLNNL